MTRRWGTSTVVLSVLALLVGATPVQAQPGAGRGEAAISFQFAPPLDATNQPHAWTAQVVAAHGEFSDAAGGVFAGPITFNQLQGFSQEDIIGGTGGMAPISFTGNVANLMYVSGFTTTTPQYARSGSFVTIVAQATVSVCMGTGVCGVSSGPIGFIGSVVAAAPVPPPDVGIAAFVVAGTLQYKGF